MRVPAVCRFAASAAVGALLLAGCGKSGGSSTPTGSISGAVSGAITEGVSVTLSGPAGATTTTAAGGTYSFSGLPNGAYVVMPRLAGYTFQPYAVGVTVDGSSVTGRDFVATAKSGTLDASFGAGGIVTTALQVERGGGMYGDGIATAMAVQPDGKIVVAGWVGGPSVTAANLGVARYDVDGTLDASFGWGGTVTTPFGRGPGVFGVYVRVPVAIQPDGKIVVAGRFEDGTSGGLGLVRYEGDGRLDAGFGSGGLVFTENVGNLSYSLAVQADGRIVAAGWDTLARYEADGTLDPTFGTGGLVTTRDFPHAVAVQRDGRIVTTGGSGGGMGPALSISRYEADGSPDPSFGTAGTTATTLLEFAYGYAVAVQEDGRIVAAGSAGTYPDPFSRASGFALARYLADGTLDSSFGNGGTVTTDLLERGGSIDDAYEVAIQEDGRVVVAGSRVTATGLVTFALARYGSDGSLDPAFGDGGRVTTAISSFSQARAVAVQPDGKIVAAGESRAGFSVARYWP